MRGAPGNTSVFADDGIERTMARVQGPGAAPRGAAAQLSAQDAADMRAMHVEAPVATKVVRAQHKFQKKASKADGNAARRGARSGVSPYGGFDDSGRDLQAYAQVGRKGGVVR